ncbi:MAG: hypothetical protein KA072_09155 [Thermoanaerobaculaceae bacterium]|nr:hypothetical protein [Thermoanaerobaculaceae bacterium]MDI9621430.1 hypothetical protein [Acidobacteriota bacterium]NLH12329.1 hypothetical protein [Holophagae bacterium]HPW55479.1 hypothetical protein [Thermoanaerobaculaceae bacterium]
MRKIVLVTLVLGLASAAMAASSVPMYIKSSEGAAQLIQALRNLKLAFASPELDTPAHEYLALIEPFLGSLHVKAKSFKDTPVEVTPEYDGLRSARKKSQLAPEHVLSQKLDEVIKAVEAASR